MTDAPVSQHDAAPTASTRPIVRPRIEPELDGLGGYRLYERLGFGGHASVYRARRIGEADACDVALKRLHPHLTSDDGAIRAFAREARLAYLLDHPVIRRVYSLGRERGELFMTMEYIDGVSVFELLRRASAARCRLPLPGILAILHRMCSALHHAHELVDELGVPAGFVHSDVSPSNVMIATRGRVKLIDMGVASTRLDGHAGGKGGIRGKYGYMAPEVLRRAPFDRRADVFSVGVVAWELLTLCRLYPVRKPAVDLEQVRSRPVSMPSTINPACPAELDLIVVRALAADPAARWPSCAAMAGALTKLALLLGESISDAAIADLVELVDERALRPRLARGTTPPSPVVGASFEAEAATVLAPPSRCGRVLALAGIGGALAALLVAGLAPSGFALPARPTPRSVTPVAPVGEVARPRTPAPPPRVAPVAAATPSPPRVAPVAAATPSPPRAAPVASATPSPPRAPDPAPPRDAPPVRLAGSPPRSWSASYPYRAQVCVDVDGTVMTVTVLDGPSRLDGRIARALRRWRYAPVDRPTCFDVRDRVEKVPGR